MEDASIITNATNGTMTTKKKKKGVLKKIAKSLTFKKKKKQSSDGNSLTGVLWDDNSIAVPSVKSAPVDIEITPRASSHNKFGPSVNSKKERSIQIVLLLMDPTSCRFELLQLEFDSTKALVSDILPQVKLSATEKILRNMIYNGVCDRNGIEMTPVNVKLVQFCKNNDVVLAMPRGMKGNETAKLASPILGDPKVVEMLRPCEVKLQHKVKNRCNSEDGCNKRLSKIDEEKFKKECNSKHSTSALDTTISSSGEKVTFRHYSILAMALLGILSFIVLLFGVRWHIRITRPILSGDVLLMGEWKSSCGIWELFPEKVASNFCNTATFSKLELGMDGILRFFSKSKNNNAETKVIWSANTSNEGSLECRFEDAVEQCLERFRADSVTILQEEGLWFAEIKGHRILLSNDVIQDFVQR